MKIQRKIYERIRKELPESPPEIGGLLGGESNIVSMVEWDNGLQKSMCSYEPDVGRLNHVIKKWHRQNIYFMGIFHTHFFGVRTLSKPDKEYIKEILDAMPEYIPQLYFPVAVLPERKLVPYIAVRQNPDVLIYEEELIILQEAEDEKYRTK